jgi:hypothetical protein
MSNRQYLIWKINLTNVVSSSDLAKYVARPEEKIVYYDNSEFKSQIDVLFQSIPHEKGQKTLLSALSLAAEVGLEAAYRYVKNKRFKQETFEEQEKLKKFLCIADEHRHDLDISYKFNHVCDLIRELRARHGDEFCGIIFVERRATCRYLCKLLGDVDLGEGIQLGFFHGQAKTTCPAVRSLAYFLIWQRADETTFVGGSAISGRYSEKV